MQTEVADAPEKPQAKWKSPDGRQWDEMWDGELHVPPMPNRMHRNLALDAIIYLKRHWAKPTGGRVNQEVNLTTPEDEATWRQNYRIPDFVLLDRPRFGIDKDEYMAGAPLTVAEVRSPGDESHEKLKFYAALGVPEVGIIDRETRAVEVHELVVGPDYRRRASDPDGWLRSPATGVEFRQTRYGKVWLRVGGNDDTAAELPED